MYAGDSKPPGQGTGDPHVLNATLSSPDLPPTSESGRALEVIEMANGDTIWFVLVDFDLVIQNLTFALRQVHRERTEG
jgi:hypothetical protein